MKCYLVVPAEDHKEKISNAIKDKFENNFHVENNAWIVSDSHATTATEVWENINAASEGDRPVGFVIQINNDRSGYYFRDFWNIVSEWENK